MPAVIELGYFNTFWLKRLNSSATPQVADITYDWAIEESRIRGGYNNTSTDLGVKAYIVEEEAAQERRQNSLIYSGIFNSRTGINNTNEFSVAEEITRSIDPIGGSIQKLYAEDTNLIVFQERKVNKALIDKDAIYSAEGSALTTSAKLVIGQVVPFGGEYGISKDPGSFAVYGYRKYFADRERNLILRLSQDGITEISSYGMMDFFRDQLGNITTGKIVGGYDVYNQKYVISLQQTNNSATDYKTLSFDERTLGWDSTYTYRPDFLTSLNGRFYSIHNSSTQAYTGLWDHYVEGITYNNFYNVTSPSTIKFVLNAEPQIVKNFNTLAYEGSNGWEITSVLSDETGENTINDGVTWTNNIDTASRIYSYNQGTYEDNGVTYHAGFDRKQNQYVAPIKNSSTSNDGEVIWGDQVTGLKGYFATVTMKTDESFTVGTNLYSATNPGGLKELFSVSSTYSKR